jgi:hypothetical protein
VQLGALPGDLGEPLGALLGDLELCPGRRHHACHAGVEAGPELFFQLEQQQVENHFEVLRGVCKKTSHTGHGRDRDKMK